jgi:hypothetical protein
VRDWDSALAKLNSLVPKDASIAIQTVPEVLAFLTSRQHVWRVGQEPKGVKYYVFLGEPAPIKDKLLYESQISHLRQQRNFNLLYESTEGKRLIVFENLDAHPIPRNEELLGWNVLGRVFADQQSIIGTAVRK